MSGERWSLEVVRGKSVGRLYPLDGRESTLGNALGGAAGVDLSGEEGTGPRRMAGKQALIEVTPQGATIRDLDSPGGTFVNRLRILPGQAKSLAVGDVIQLGGVQVKLVAPASNGAVASAPAAGVTANWSFPVAGAPACKTWDDILKLSAQRWEALREEVTSGRAENFVRSIGRLDLIPPGGGNPDERLDGWLALLPTTKAKDPVPEVHPEKLSVKVVPGGGSTNRSLTISNVGYRLLRVRGRVESGADWLKLGAIPATIVERATVPIEIAIPEHLNTPLTGKLVFEAAGVAREVAVTLEAKPAGEAEPTASVAVAAPPSFAWPLRTRLIWFAAVAVLARSVVGIAEGITGSGLVPESVERPSLFGPLVVFAAIGAVFGLITALKRREDAEGVAAWVVSPAITGAMIALGLTATARFVEPLLGAAGRSPIGQGVVWAGLGAAAAYLSTLVAPPPRKETTP